MAGSVREIARRQCGWSEVSEGETERRGPWDFPGGPVGKTPHSQCGGPGFDSWSRN